MPDFRPRVAIDTQDVLGIELIGRIARSITFVSI